MKRLTMVAGVLAVTLTACGGDEPAPHDRNALEAVPVTVTDARTAPGSRSHVARVEAANQAQVATRASGTLLRVPVDVGDRVGQGQVLASLDDSDVRARIAAAQAAVALAERTHGRVERLQADGAASRQELDEALARLEAARAQLEEARAQSAYVQVTAPFAGVVTARHADPGDLAVPGRPVLTIASSGALTITADLPSSERAGVEVGAVLGVVDARGRRSEARVTRVVPTLDARTGRFRVELAPTADADLTPGETVRLEVAGTGTGTRWLPDDAIVRRGQLTGVYAVERDTLRLRWIRTGRQDGTWVEVLSGPAGPLTVVRRPGATLVDGQPVASVTRETTNEADGR